MKKIFCAVFVVMFPLFVHAKDKKMSVESTSWKDGQAITNAYVFNSFGCSGENISPNIKWKNLPATTKSIAVTIYDPDAPTGSGWWHWIIYNISPKMSGLREGEGTFGESKIANGASQNGTDFGSPGYGGPCPPAGDKPHHYTLTAHALDVEKLELPANATGAMAGFYINQHTIAKSSLTALYGR